LGLGTFLLVAALGLVGLIAARLTSASPKTIVPSMMFNNCGNLGLPLAVLAFGKDAMPAAVVMFLVSNMLHFSFGAWYLDHKARLRDLWKVPVLLATVFGLGLNLTEVHLWPPLMTAIRMLGEVSIPLMMFALGVRLAGMTLAELHLGLLIAVLRPVSGMALAYVVGWSLNLTGIQFAQLIVFGALPPAVLNYMFAERYSQEPEKVASMVLIGNVAALVFIPLALMFVLG
jgi:predicted permease